MPDRKLRAFLHHASHKKASSYSDKLSTISIETLGGISTPIYYKGESIPFKKSLVYSTVEDNQTKIEIHLVLGENRLASDNVSLGRYSFDRIPPAKRGVPQIEVQFELDETLNLGITATDKSTGRIEHLGNIALTNYSAPPIKDPLPSGSDANDLSGGGGLSDFFQTIFGNAKRTPPMPPNSYQMPKDYQQFLEISMEEAYTGKIHFFEINGVSKRLHIPAGVQTGTTLRLIGAGPDGSNFYLIISVRPHRFFAQSGSDLLMHYPVSEIFAYHGGEIRIPLLENGKSIRVAIPPGTKDKQVIRFANKGFPKVKSSTEFGDFYLTIDLYDPWHMPEEFKKLLEDIDRYMR